MTNKQLFKIIAIVSFAVFIIVFFTEGVPNHYSLLTVLPLVYSVSAFVLANSLLNSSVNVATIIIGGLTSVRYVLIPLLMILGNQHTIMKLGIVQNANYGILLMIYECVTITIAIIAAYRKFYTANIEYDFTPYFDKKIFKIIFLLFLFCVFMLATNPMLLNNYMTIFTMNQEEFTMGNRIEQESVGSLMRILQTLYTVVFNIVRVMLPIYIVGYLANKKKSNIFVFCIVMLLVFIEFMMITATFAEAIVSALIILLAVVKINKPLGKLIAKFAPLGVVFIVVGWFIARMQVSEITGHESQFSGNNLIETLCATFSAYFTGVDNVAAAFNMSTETRWEHFFDTLQVTIPFNTTIFGKANEIIQTLFNASNGTIGQIPSTIGDGWYFFGPILAPFFSFLFAYNAIKYNIKGLATFSYWRYICYLFISIILSLGLGMYNESITLNWINGWALPILLFVWLSEKKRV